MLFCLPLFFDFILCLWAAVSKQMGRVAGRQSSKPWSSAAEDVSVTTVHLFSAHLSSSAFPSPWFLFRGAVWCFSLCILPSSYALPSVLCILLSLKKNTHGVPLRMVYCNCTSFVLGIRRKLHEREWRIVKWWNTSQTQQYMSVHWVVNANWEWMERDFVISASSLMYRNITASAGHWLRLVDSQ